MEEECGEEKKKKGKQSKKNLSAFTTALSNLQLSKVAFFSPFRHSSSYPLLPPYTHLPKVRRVFALSANAPVDAFGELERQRGRESTKREEAKERFRRRRASEQAFSTVIKKNGMAVFEVLAFHTLRPLFVPLQRALKQKQSISGLLVETWSQLSEK